MKFFVSLIVIVIVTAGVYLITAQITGRNKKNKKKKEKAIRMALLAAVILLELLLLAMYSAAAAPDTQCTTVHNVNSFPPVDLNTAMDYFNLGNYYYDKGNCPKAIADYTKSIKLNPNYAQAYNNRAYTYMRIQDYRQALPDLDKALSLNPDYIQALMNRGDIYNYYYSIDRQRAIADYQRVIMLGGTQGTSVCGHLFLARNNGWNIVTVLGFPLAALHCM